MVKFRGERRKKNQGNMSQCVFQHLKGTYSFAQTGLAQQSGGEGNVSSVRTSIYIIFVNLRCKLFVESQLHPL